MSVGRPGSEPLTTQQLTAELAAQSAAGRPGTVHPTGEAHRTAVNQTLYGLSPQRYAVLRQTLLQLRRPKLSDKLDENGLNKILRDSLPTVSEAIVEDLAEGFERLDRHSAAVEELEKTLGDLRRAPQRLPGLRAGRECCPGRRSGCRRVRNQHSRGEDNGGRICP